MIPEVTINELWTEKDNPDKNPTSSAKIRVKHIGYTVNGGFFAESVFKTTYGRLDKALTRAEAERDRRNAFNRKYPWTPPRSKHELAKAKFLRLPVPIFDGK